MKIGFTKKKWFTNRENKKLREGMAIFLLVISFAGVAAIFWYNEWVYNLPTPVPARYRDVKPGSLVDITGYLKTGNNHPVLLHFFNPDCPCSRFNIPHFKSLVKQYGGRVNFAIVAVCTQKQYSATDIQSKFNLQVPVLFDLSLATACGVYSTPQAVIIDSGHHLYYRGNYNKSRYCTDAGSNYAKMALDSLLGNNSFPALGIQAFKAYGCQLPKCTN